MNINTAAVARQKYERWERLKQVETEIQNILTEVANGEEIKLDIRAGAYLITDVTHPQAATVLNNRLTAVQSQISTLETEIAGL